jgi:hypothetical protein
MCLKKWEKHSHFANQRAQELCHQLVKIQQQMEEEEVIEDLHMSERETNIKLHKVFKKEEEEWILKSRSLWLKSGDRNTTFFHNQSKARRQRNNVKFIMQENGQRLDNFEEIKEATKRHFEALYISEETPPRKKPTSINAMLENIPHLISEEENQFFVAGN